MGTPNERVKYLRKEVLKLTQNEFSKKIKISRSNLGNIEINKVSLTERVLFDICHEFDINQDWILTGNGDIFNSLEEDEYAALVAKIDLEDSRMKQAIIDYCHLNQKEKELFWNFIDTFMKNK